MNLDFFTFRDVPQKEITISKISEVLALSPRKICFNSTHKNALKDESNNDKPYLGKISLPFFNSIGPIFEYDTQLKLFSSKFDTFWRSIKDEDDLAKAKEFIQKYNSIVFLRDCLDLSIALAENFDENNNHTHIGFLEFDAKYGTNGTNDQSLNNLIDIVSDTIKTLPFYKHADFICSIPPSKIGGSNCPRKIVEGLTGFEFQNISSFVNWRKDKEQLKEVDIQRKLEILEETGVNIDFEINGKSIILIDDLYQSGVTMNFVAMKLKEAGAIRIFGISIVKSRSNTDNV